MAWLITKQGGDGALQIMQEGLHGTAGTVTDLLMGLKLGEEKLVVEHVDAEEWLAGRPA